MNCTFWSRVIPSARTHFGISKRQNLVLEGLSLWICVFASNLQSVNRNCVPYLPTSLFRWVWSVGSSRVSFRVPEPILVSLNVKTYLNSFIILYIQLINESFFFFVGTKVQILMGSSNKRNHFFCWVNFFCCFHSFGSTFRWI